MLEKSDEWEKEIEDIPADLDGKHEADGHPAVRHAVCFYKLEEMREEGGGRPPSI